MTVRGIVKGEEICLEDLRSDCLEFERQRNLAARSSGELNRYLGDLIEYVETVGLRELQELTPQMLQEFIQQRGEGLSPATVKGIVWSVRKFCEFLTMRGHFEKNPAAALHHPRISPRANLPAFLDEHELRCLLNTAADSGQMQDFVLLSLFASTGMRPHEVSSLSFGDVDEDAFCVYHRVKGNWRKETALNQGMTELLGRWKTDRREDSEEAPIFVNTRGNRAQVPWIQARVKHLGRAAGLDRPLTPKMLRHTFATHAADRNGRIMTKALIGHSTLTRAMVYMHLCPMTFRNIMQKHPYAQQIERGGRHDV